MLRKYDYNYAVTKDTRFWVVCYRNVKVKREMGKVGGRFNDRDVGPGMKVCRKKWSGREEHRMNRNME